MNLIQPTNLYKCVLLDVWTWFILNRIQAPLTEDIYLLCLQSIYDIYAEICKCQLVLSGKYAVIIHIDNQYRIPFTTYGYTRSIRFDNMQKIRSSDDKLMSCADIYKRTRGWRLCSAVI